MKKKKKDRRIPSATDRLTTLFPAQLLRKQPIFFGGDTDTGIYKKSFMEVHTTEATVDSAVLPVISTVTTETLEHSTLPVVSNLQATVTLRPQATQAMEKSVMASDCDNLIASPERHQGLEMRQVTTAEEEVIGILKVIAATGKFWSDWEKLRSMLSLHLMQVISEYPEAKMTTHKQKISLGETHAELAKRLDNALHSFVDGPPFTLQRLSEIILEAQILYPNLSKLALALEKNLSVTSTLTFSTDPQLQSDTVMENGAPPVVVAADRDEIMTEVEADVSNVMMMNVETTEKPSDSSPMTTDIVGSSCVLVHSAGLSKL